ncbi:MAG: radical SAM protein [Phycisphaerae bacterium]|nr:radical SAM protein [Saprospiraceae bacterium]
MRNTNITGFRFRLFELRMFGQLVRTAFSVYPKKGDALRALKRHIHTHLEFKETVSLNKAVRVGERYYMQMSLPGFGTNSLNVLAINELNRHVPIPGHPPGLNTLLLAITKKCSLQCAHCFEWDNLNQREQLSAEDVLNIIRKFQSDGVANIELSGGEPLNRYADLLQIVRESDTNSTDFWLVTSGYRLTAERAMELKGAGLAGVCVSLDHWDAASHDAFRGMEGSFDWAMQAAKNAKAAGMVVSFGLTALRDFCTEEHLMRYAQLAHAQGAHFIRILEPRAVGHFAGKEVELGRLEMGVLEAFMKTLQTERAYWNFPIVEYYAAYQRRAGCSGAGQRFLYVDTDGDMHACPFCQNKCGNVLCDGIETGRQRMEQASGCHAYSMS